MKSELELLKLDTFTAFLGWILFSNISFIKRIKHSNVLFIQRMECLIVEKKKS